jgi:uncharacterized protein YecE (DUF72 family)
MAEIRIGTSAFTAAGWETAFYPAVTHDKCLKGCEDDLIQFVDNMGLMGSKLGPLLFQFGYFNKTAFKRGKEFLARLEPLGGDRAGNMSERVNCCQDPPFATLKAV